MKDMSKHFTDERTLRPTNREIANLRHHQRNTPHDHRGNSRHLQGWHQFRCFPKPGFGRVTLGVAPRTACSTGAWTAPTATPILSVQPRKPAGVCVHEEGVGVHSSAAGTQTGQNTGHKRAEDPACEPHVGAHTAPETTGCECRAATANTHTFLCACVHVRMCTDTDYSFKKRRETQNPG